MLGIKQTTLKLFVTTLLLLSFSSTASEQKKCLLLMSYHQGYEWNDGIENGVDEKLAGICQLKKVFMDTKRNSSISFGKKAAQRAIAIISQFKPDIVIAADDNASRYVVEPYFKNKTLPFVFCGINWTAEEYGYPYKNATGMVEVAPIIPLLKNIQYSLDDINNGIYLSSDVITEHKDFQRYEMEYRKRGVKLTSIFVSSLAAWKDAYLYAQRADFIIVNNKAGINDWDTAEITQFVNQNSKTLTVTNYRWMMPYAMLGMTKNAREQGLWAGDVAAAILKGLPVGNIPITVNKSWDLYINEPLLNKSNIKLSNRILHHAYKSWQ